MFYLDIIQEQHLTTILFQSVCNSMLTLEVGLIV